MPALAFRPAEPGDIPALTALDTSARSDPARAQAIVEWVNAGSCSLAELNGIPAGYAVVTRHFFNQPILELVMIGPSYRRQGIGGALIQRAIQAVPEPVLWTSTNQSNLPMQTLLAKLGFRRSGIVEGLDEGDPELIYRIATKG